MKKGHNPILTTDELLSKTNSKDVVQLQGLVVANTTMPTDTTGMEINFRTDSFAFMLVLTGVLHIRINLRDYSLRKGDLFIMSPSSLKQLVSSSRNMRCLAIGFTPNTLTWMGGNQGKNSSALLEYFSGKFTPHWPLEAGDIELFKHVANELRRRMQVMDQTAFGKELLVHSFFIALYELAAMAKKYAYLIASHVSRKEDLALRFIDLASKQVRTQRNVQEYGRQLHVTPNYLTETVKEITGKTAGEFIDYFVVLEAKTMLLDSTLTIAQVAEELNFSDQSFFGKFFKRHVGMSPKQYKQSSLPSLL
jgi:AraC-like DNA-binding protein